MNGVKYSLSHPHVLPDTAIVDSQFTDNLPPNITACAGIDALCQATESFWAVGATPESQGYAAEAIELLRRTIIGAVNEPDNQSRDVMMRAANLAGKSINISKTTAPMRSPTSSPAVSVYPMATRPPLPWGGFLRSTHRSLQRP